MHLALSCLNKEVIHHFLSRSIGQSWSLATSSYKESGKCNLLLCSGSSIRSGEQIAHLFHIISGLTAAWYKERNQPALNLGYKIEESGYKPGFWSHVDVGWLLPGYAPVM